MKIKTSELTGAALDWAVWVAAGGAAAYPRTASGKAFLKLWKGNSAKHVHPSTDPSQAWPIIDREGIAVHPMYHAERTESGSDIYRKDGWAAHIEPKAFWITHRPFAGPTSLIAAMRCYVASELGDEVEVPEELL